MTTAPTPFHSRQATHGLQLALAAVVILAAIAIAALLVRDGVFGSSSTSNAVLGSGIVATQTRELAPFGSVELAGSNDVFISVGGKQSVVVHADDNLLGRVTTDVRGGSLVIGNRPGSFITKSPMRVDVHVPSLEALTLNGSGIISATGVKTPSLTMAISGSGVLRVSGNATRLDVRLSGSGDAEAAQLVARDVHAVVRGSGRILVTATERLDASVPGSGAIIYSGEPSHVTTSISGSGTVLRG
ncbi:MAG: head GIN domain-containing protein [Gaiellaceae bacterium]